MEHFKANLNLIKQKLDQMKISFKTSIFNVQLFS